MKPIIILLTLIVLSASVKLPPNFQKCKRNELNLKKCVFKAAQNGISQLTRPYDELNLPNLKPLHLAELVLDGEGGPITLHQKFKNCDLYGLDTLQLDHFEFNFEKHFLKMVGVFPEIRKLCQYEVKGRVLLLPVDEKGDSIISLKGLKITDVLYFEERVKMNRTYLQFTNSFLTLDPDFVSYNFTNSDSRLSDAINPMLIKNWREMFSDVKGYYEKLINKIVFNLGNNFFSKVSIEEAFD